MYSSIALYDSVAAIMDPEELKDLGSLVDFANEHGFNPESLIAPVVDAKNTRFILQAFNNLGGTIRSQLAAAGVTHENLGRIVNAFAFAPERGYAPRWDAAYRATLDLNLPCTAWAVVADVSKAWGWLNGADADFSVYMAKHLNGEAFIAFKAAWLRRCGRSLADTWERVA